MKRIHHTNTDRVEVSLFSQFGVASLEHRFKCPRDYPGPKPILT